MSSFLGGRRMLLCQSQKKFNGGLKRLCRELLEFMDLKALNSFFSFASSWEELGGCLLSRVAT